MHHHAQYDLSWRTCEERACQRADLDLGDGRLVHIYNVHSGRQCWSGDTRRRVWPPSSTTIE